jgi:uncharacterized protein (DUF924 family)
MSAGSGNDPPSGAAGLPSADDVLDFWFGKPGSPDYLQPNPAWFRKDPAFDAVVAERFGGLLDLALRGGADAVAGLPRGDDPTRQALARIIVCDQFPRNAWRDRPSAFALDPIALATSHRLIGTPAERALAPVQRVFVYMPLMHAESLEEQARCVALFKALAEEWSEAASNYDYALQHEAIIRRFGRFPHRNEILGRASTPEELAFLKEPGSRF